MRRSWRNWILFGGVAWTGGIALTYQFRWAGDQAFFLPGPTTHGHHQIELKCSACHTPFMGVKTDACNDCHAAELAAFEDSHPRSKFTDPRNAGRLARINAAECVTCHREHQPEFTQAMGVTQPSDFCYHCHQDIAQERPSHRGLEFGSCATAGCHNFHDNTALYEDFVAKHTHEPDTRTPAHVPTRLAVGGGSRAAEAAPVQADRSVPAAIVFDQHVVYDWEQSVHAAAGVSCRDCHQAGDPSAAWNAKPAPEDCARCHATEVAGFLESRHGMRLAAGLSPMTPAQARLPMHAAAAHHELSCNSCHGAHRYDTRVAAVDACMRCHDDAHTRAYHASPHFRLWRDETFGHAPPGSGVSCATCHLPRETHRVGGEDVVRVQHNQNATLRPNEKMIRPVCLHCHGYGFALDALADRALIDANFHGRPSHHVETIDFVARRLAERLPPQNRNQTANEP